MFCFFPGREGDFLYCLNPAATVLSTISPSPGTFALPSNVDLTRADLAQFRFTGTVVSYPDRGPWGNPKWRGNTSGYIVLQFLGTFHNDRNKLFVDPMAGSGTSKAVADAAGVRNQALDLHSGFDVTRTKLLEATNGEYALTAFLHPPYGDMVPYSGFKRDPYSGTPLHNRNGDVEQGMWGDEPDARDMSHVGKDVHTFLEMMQAGLQNVYEGLETKGHYAVLLGVQRTQGRLIDYPSELLKVAPGTLVDEIVKIQHNCVSDARSYSGQFTQIQHEKMLVFRKDAESTIFTMTNDCLEGIRRVYTGSVRNMFLGWVRQHYGSQPFSVREAYEVFSREFEESIGDRKDTSVYAKLRQTVQDPAIFERHHRGVYAFSKPMSVS